MQWKIPWLAVLCVGNSSSLLCSNNLPVDICLRKHHAVVAPISRCGNWGLFLCIPRCSNKISWAMHVPILKVWKFIDHEN